MLLIWLIGGFVLGAVLGSFANVVIHRVPQGKSVVYPGSACPACEHALAPKDNIPIISWVLLRARCRYCGAKISARYPAIEVLFGLIFAVLGGLTYLLIFG